MEYLTICLSENSLNNDTTAIMSCAINYSVGINKNRDKNENIDIL